MYNEQLSSEIEQLNAAASELTSLKKGRAVYLQRSKVLFLSSKESAKKDIDKRLAEFSVKSAHGDCDHIKLQQ